MKPFKTKIASNALNSMIEHIDRNRIPAAPEGLSTAEYVGFALGAWKQRLETIFEAHKAAAAIEMEYYRNLAIMA